MDQQSRKLDALPGLGALTVTAVVAAVGNARQFANGRSIESGFDPARALQRG